MPPVCLSDDNEHIICLNPELQVIFVGLFWFSSLPDGLFGVLGLGMLGRERAHHPELQV